MVEDSLADDRLVETQELVGGLVAEARAHIRRALDVGEQDGDGAFGRFHAHPERMIPRAQNPIIRADYTEHLDA